MCTASGIEHNPSELEQYPAALLKPYYRLLRSIKEFRKE